MVNTTTLAKGAGILLGISGLGTGAYYGIKSLETSKVKSQQQQQKENIKSLLEKEGYTLLTNESSNVSTVLDNYKRAITNTSLKLENFDGNNDSSGKVASAILIEKCVAILENTDTNNKTDINKAKRWCVEPTTITALLAKKNITPLNTAGDTDKPKWQQKIEEYNDSNNSQKQKIEGLDLSSSDPNTEDQKITNIKGKCKDLATKANHEDKFEENLKAFKLWCV